MVFNRFTDRRDAGRRLAAKLEAWANRPDVVVLALPRGGVPVAFEVARSLAAPLDVCVVRKLGVPGQEELAMGAIASGGTRVINQDIVAVLNLDADTVEHVTRRETLELERREATYRGSRAALPIADRTVILVDDGMATGSSVLAAVLALRHRAPDRIIVAVPVAARSVADRLREVADAVICVLEPDALDGVSMWYIDFDQTRDDEVRNLLGAAQPAVAAAAGAAQQPATGQLVTLDADGVPLLADLVVPVSASGLVIFVHGSGSSRRSTRNRHVAATLQRAGLATLLLDLLTADEDQIDQRTRHLRFDIGLLTGRVVAVIDRAADDHRLRALPIGLFGASTGAAAALFAAARRPARVRAVVSRGGRPDLAGSALPLVRAPTLLIVGGRDYDVLELNRSALAALATEKRLEIVPEATHLFEEPGALERVARLATDWFVRHLKPDATHGSTQSEGQ